MYRILTHKSVDTFLHKHPELGRRFVEKFGIIAQDPYRALLDIKSLKGKPSHFRLRIGDYRFLYEIQESDKIIWIWRADSRGGVYEGL